jgi:hypothetical protein
VRGKGRVLVENPVRVQAVRGKKRTVSEPPKARGPAHFTILLAKGMKGAVDAGVPIKIELGVPSGDGHGTVTVLDEWMGNRAR